MLDEAHCVVSANHAFAAIAERARPDVVGKTLEELVTISPLPEPDGGLLEVSYCRLSGDERYLQMSLASYRSDDEPLWVLVVQDVSERVRIEQELIPKLAQLVARQEKRSRRSRFEPFGSLAARGSR